MKKQLLCGAGKAPITPPLELLPQIITLGGMVFGEISDELQVRVVLLDDGARRAAIVCFELDKAPYPEKFTALVSELTGARERDILMLAVHTHTAPVTGDRPFEPKHDITRMSPEVQAAMATYNALLEERLTQAARQAVETLRPAVLGFGQGQSYINVNRCGVYQLERPDSSPCIIAETGVNPTGPVDHTVSVMKIEEPDGQPIAFFVNFPVHCLTMFKNNRGDGRSVVSGDIAGRVSGYIEHHYPGSVAIWCSGAAGDSNPIMMTLTAYPHPMTGEPVLDPINSLDASREICLTMAGRHFADIKEVIEKIRCIHRSLELTSGEVWVKVPAKDNILRQPDGPLSDEPYRVRLHLVRLGDLALVGVNGELYCSLGRIIQQTAPVKNVVVINHDASLVLDGPGYILDDDTAYSCQRADIVRLPNSGFRAVPGYLADALKEGTRKLFNTAD